MCIFAVIIIMMDVSYFIWFAVNTWLIRFQH